MPEFILTKSYNAYIVYSVKCVAICLAAAAAFLSCSFNYSDAEGGKTPDMVFSGAIAQRYSDGKKTMEIEAATMEVYISEKIWAAENVRFAEFSDDGTEENSASAGIMLLDEQNEIYTLGGNVTFYIGEDDLAIRGEDLRWEKRIYFISAPAESAVEIAGESISASGTGFSANTQDRSYSFAGKISGMLIPKDEGESAGEADGEALNE